MKENLILEQNLYEAAEMLRSNKRMINLTYAERVYLQQWIYEKTGNRISSQKCDLEQALYLFYEAKKPKDAVVDEQVIDEIIENSEVTKKQTTTSKKKRVNKNDSEEKTKKTGSEV